MPEARATQDKLWQDYELLLSGYHSRDQVVSQTFHEMIQAFAVWLVLLNAAQIVWSDSWLLVVQLVLAVSGLVSLFAYLLDLQGNTSARRALRRRCIDIEDSVKVGGPTYWKTVRGREKFFEERVVKPNGMKPEHERFASSNFLVVAGRLLIVSWVLFVIFIIAHPSLGGGLRQI